MSTVRVVEKFYSAQELAGLIGFNSRFWCDRMKSEPELKDGDGIVISSCVLISGEYFAPASWVNGFLARRKVDYNPGIKARNRSDLERKLRGQAVETTAVAG